ncbi:hypothetical protein T492DRAFT_501007 [Pavlovales sp. CCMP2436]|nr:hypothetical protein T492DRAFT_501007 [Pavlovales sp. CCMP2436]
MMLHQQHQQQNNGINNNTPINNKNTEKDLSCATARATTSITCKEYGDAIDGSCSQCEAGAAAAPASCRIHNECAADSYCASKGSGKACAPCKSAGNVTCEVWLVAVPTPICARGVAQPRRRPPSPPWSQLALFPRAPTGAPPLPSRAAQDNGDSFNGNCKKCDAADSNADWKLFGVIVIAVAALIALGAMFVCVYKVRASSGVRHRLRIAARSSRSAAPPPRLRCRRGSRSTARTMSSHSAATQTSARWMHSPDGRGARQQ